MRFLLSLLIASAAFAGEFTTSLGDTYPYTISAIAADSAGNTYVVRNRRLGTSTDVFVSKLDPNGKLLFTNRFGGDGRSTGSGIALDPSGNIYIGGTTTASDFPLSRALQTQSNSSGSGFIVKLTNDGTTIFYATYFGGAQGMSSIIGLATDTKGNLYVTGSTFASDYPQTAGLPTLEFALASGTIVAEISAAGDRIVYSGAIAPVTRGSPGGPVGIAVDAAGNAYIGGNLNDSSLVTTPGALLPRGSGAYVAKVNAGGAGTGYATYLGSGGLSLGVIKVDATGNAYLGGLAINGFFPTTPGSLQPTVDAPRQTLQLGFLAKLSPTGTAMVWATYIGGTAEGAVHFPCAGREWQCVGDGNHTVHIISQRERMDDRRRFPGRS